MKTRLSPKGILIISLIVILAIFGPLRDRVTSAPYFGVPSQYIFYWVDHFKFWGQKAPSPRFRGLEIPTINDRPLTGAPIGPHFRSSKAQFILVSRSTNIYVKPSVDSRLITTLPIGTRVRAVFQNEEISAQNSEGRGLWVFLTEEDGKAPIGWAINNTLGYQDRFVPVTQWNIAAFGMCIGEYCGEFFVKKNGRFNQIWESIGRGIHLSGTNTGQFLEFQDIVWAKQDDPEDYDELLVKSGDRQLSHEVKYSGEPIRMSAANGQPIRFSKK